MLFVGTDSGDGDIKTSATQPESPVGSPYSFRAPVSQVSASCTMNVTSDTADEASFPEDS